MTRLLILLVAGSALTLLPGDSVDAGCHAVHVQKQAVVAYQPVVAPYYYSVGQGLQLRAAIEVAKEELRAEMRAMQLNSPGNSESSPERLPLTAEVDRWANTKQVCAGCHTTDATAMEAFSMADFSLLTCEQKLGAVKHLAQGTMPPPGKKQITPEQRGQIIGEFAGANNVDQP